MIPRFALLGMRHRIAVVTLSLMAAQIGSADATTRPVGPDGTTLVQMQVVMLNLDEIKGVTQHFTANVAYSTRWHDPRLSHPGPGDRTVPLSSIWHPRLQIVNQQRLMRTLPEEAQVSPAGDVQVLQRVWGNFSQALILHEFPFDSQTLEINFVSTWHESGAVRFEKDPVYPSAVLPSFSVPDWIVMDWKVGPEPLVVARPDQPLPAFNFSIELKRNFGFYLVNLVLPMVMIIGMSWVVFWISFKNTGPRISVSITAMLTLVAYRFAVRASLPNIGYLTRMDWFILGSSLIVFTNLLVVIYTSWLAENEDLDRAHLINRRMRIISPIVFVLFCLFALAR